MEGRIHRLRRSKFGVVAVAGLAVFADMLLYTVLFPLQPHLLEVSGVPKSDLNYYTVVLSSVYSFGLFIATPIFGLVSDRFRTRQLPMLGGLFALTIATLLFAFIRNITWLIVARVLMGISAGATWVLGFAMLSDTFSPDDGLGLAIAVVITLHTFGGFVGPLIGGFLGQHYGLQCPFLLCAALTGLDFLMRLLIKPPRPKSTRVPEDATPNEPQKARHGYLALLKTRDLFLALVCILIVSASITPLESLMPVWLQSPPWNLSQDRAGAIMLAIILPNALVSFLIGRLSESVPRLWIIMAGLVLHGISAPFPFGSQNIPQLIVFCVFFGATAPIISSATSAHMASIVDRRGGKSYARMYALLNMTWSIGATIGPIAVEFVNRYWNLWMGMLLITVACFAFLPILYVGSSAHWKGRRKRASQPDAPQCIEAGGEGGHE